MTVPEPGIYKGVPFEEYRSWPAMNIHSLMNLDVSPAYYQLKLASPDQPTSDQLFGTAAHLLVLEGQSAFDREFTVLPKGARNDSHTAKALQAGTMAQTLKGDEIDIPLTTTELRTRLKGAGVKGLSKANKAQLIELYYTKVEGIDPEHFRAALEKAPTRKTLSHSDYRRVRELAEAVKAHPKIGPRLEKGVPEVSVVWEDPPTGILMKARLDLVAPSELGTEIGDLKTTKSVHPDSFQKAMGEYLLHWQAAAYLVGLSTVLKRDVRQFRFWAAEREVPHHVEVHEPDQPALSAGYAGYRRALETYRNCREVNRWPSTTGHVHKLSLPPWQANRAHLCFGS